MAEYQILSWHGIPTTVRARQGGERASRPLSPRFMEAVDRAAMRARLTGHRNYPKGFRWSEPQEREGTPEAVVEAVAAEIEARYPVIEWRQLADRLREERAKADQSPNHQVTD